MIYEGYIVWNQWFIKLYANNHTLLIIFSASSFMSDEVSCHLNDFNSFDQIM